SPSAPRLDTDLAERVLVAFLREESARAGILRLVIGLSGGVDSAVAAILAARAVGPANVTALALPVRESSSESVAHARLAALASALNPLGDLYKGQVRALARHLGVPAVVVDKAPSADLRPGQTDEGDFGFTYEQADAILFRLVDQRSSPEQLVADGFPDAIVR